MTFSVKKDGSWSCQAVGPNPSALTASGWSNSGRTLCLTWRLKLKKCCKGKFDKNSKKQSVTKEAKEVNQVSGRKKIGSDKDDRAPKQHSKEMNKDAPIAVCLGPLFRGQCLVRCRMQVTRLPKSFKSKSLGLSLASVCVCQSLKVDSPYTLKSLKPLKPASNRSMTLTFRDVGPVWQFMRLQP